MSEVENKIKEVVEKYAILIQSVTLDFQMNKINHKHYMNTLSLIVQQLEESTKILNSSH